MLVMRQASRSMQLKTTHVFFYLKKIKQKALSIWYVVLD